LYRSPIEPSVPPLSSTALAGVPDAVVRAILVASVPPALRALFRKLPRPLRLDAELSHDPEDLPHAARQLLKLATADEHLRLGELSFHAPGTRPTIVVSGGGVSLRLDADRLAAGLEALAPALLLALHDASALLDVAQRFAAESARLSALHALTRLMLRGTDLDRALYVLLTGVTSGHALGFHRAGLFLRDDARGRYVGDKAIGPFDAAEAHRIWEAIEVEGKTFEHLIEDYARADVDTRLQRAVEGTELSATDAPDDEIAIAERSTGPVLFRSARPRSPGLAALGISGEFVLQVIQPHGRVLGLLWCDDRFGAGAIEPDRLAALATFVEQVGLVWQNFSLLDRVEKLARFDGLTSVLNRRAIEAHLADAQARAVGSERPLSVLLLDVDHFKEVNDSRGHAAGDAVLRVLAGVLRATVRGADHVGRFGGDEFVLVLPDAGEADAARVARRIGDAAGAAGISVSIGGASWPTPIDEVDALLSAADASLYEAKREGRARARLSGGTRLEFSRG
jgi:diguanylate cyclase (GGDEF)-like protein